MKQKTCNSVSSPFSGKFDRAQHEQVQQKSKSKHIKKECRILSNGHDIAMNIGNVISDLLFAYPFGMDDDAYDTALGLEPQTHLRQKYDSLVMSIATQNR